MTVLLIKTSAPAHLGVAGRNTSRVLGRPATRRLITAAHQGTGSSVWQSGLNSGLIHHRWKPSRNPIAGPARIREPKQPPAPPERRLQRAGDLSFGPRCCSSRALSPAEASSWSGPSSAGFHSLTCHFNAQRPEQLLPGSDPAHLNKGPSSCSRSQNRAWNKAATW